MANYFTKSQWAIGGVALASVGVLAYTLVRPTKEQSKKKKNKKKGPKTSKFEYKIKKRPIDINLVMFSDEGFHAHVAGDKKNKKLGLKFGARLFKINDKKVENLTYEEIATQLMRTKPTINLIFKEFPNLESDWEEAESFREKGNGFYKDNNTGQAIAECSKAIKLHPTNKVYYSNRILMYIKLNQLEAALEDCQKIRELDPLSLYVKGHYLRGLVLFNLKKIKHAAAAFQTVMKLEPSFKQAKVRLDDCLKKLKVMEDKEEAKTNEKRRSSEVLMTSKVVDAVSNDITVSSVKEDAPAEGQNVQKSIFDDPTNVAVAEPASNAAAANSEMSNNNENNNENKNDDNGNDVVDDNDNNESKDLSNDENDNNNNNNNNESNNDNNDTDDNNNENNNENSNENDNGKKDENQPKSVEDSYEQISKPVVPAVAADAADAADGDADADAASSIDAPAPEASA